MSESIESPVLAVTFDFGQTLCDLDLKYPTLTADKQQGLVEAKKVLMAEGK